MRLSVVAVSAIAALLAASSPTHARTIDHDRSWSESWTIEGRPSIEVRAEDAQVRIHTRPGAEVEVRVRSSGSTGGFFSGELRPVVSLEREGSRVTVAARMAGTTAGFVISSVRLEVDVWTPEASDLRVVVEDGSVAAGPLEGTVDIRGEDARIEVAGLKGDIRLASTDGRIEAQGLEGRLTLRSKDGDSVVHGRFDGLAMQTDDGDLDVVVAGGSKPSDDWSLRTRDGSIRLRLAGDLAATLDAATDDGRLEVDLPVVVRGRVQRHALRGDLNGGGPVLSLRAQDGGIRVMPLD